jgi:hypothetical protein
VKTSALIEVAKEYITACVTENIIFMLSYMVSSKYCKSLALDHNLGGIFLVQLVILFSGLGKDIMKPHLDNQTAAVLSFFRNATDTGTEWQLKVLEDKQFITDTSLCSKTRTRLGNFA